MNCTASTIAQGRESDPPAAVREGDQHGHQARDERADERHERAQKDDHGEGECERYAQQPESDPDECGVDRGDERRAPDEAAEHRPGPPPHPVDHRPRVRRETLDDPGPERLAVAEYEVENGDGQHQAGDEGGTRLDARNERSPTASAQTPDRDD